MTCPVEVILARNEKSERGKIPPEVIEKMVERISKETPPPWWKHDEWNEEQISAACETFSIDPDHPEEPNEVERRQLNG